MLNNSKVVKIFHLSQLNQLKLGFNDDHHLFQISPSFGILI